MVGRTRLFICFLILCLFVLLLSISAMAATGTVDNVDPVAYLPAIAKDYSPYLRWAVAISRTTEIDLAAVAETGSGDLAVAGWAGDETRGWLGLFKPNGALAWQKFYEGAAFVDMQPVENDGVIAVGSLDTTEGWRTVGTVLRLHQDGTIRWVRYLEDETYLKPYAVGVWAEDNFVILGHRWNLPFVWMFDDDGLVEWQVSTGFVGSYEGLKTTAANDDSIFVFGRAFDQGGFLLKLHPYTGAIIWQKRYQVRFYWEEWDCPIIEDITFTSDGGYAAVCSCEDRDPALLKLTNSGDVAWMKTYNIPGGEFKSVLERDGGHIIVAGEQSLNEASAGFIMQLEPDGDVVWAKTYSMEGDGTIEALVASAAGGYVAIGSTGDQSGWLIRPDKSGLLAPSCDLQAPAAITATLQSDVQADTLDWTMAATSYESYLGTPDISPGDLVSTRLCPAPLSVTGARLPLVTRCR